MKRLSKVVWKEGMYLAPHHFQAQGRFFEDLIDFTVAALRYKPYGLCAADFDTDSLKNGIVLARRLRGVFPDGLAFDCPASDPAPEPLALVNRFPSARASEILRLAVPDRSDSGPDFAKRPGDGTRFQAVPVLVRDETNGVEERELEVGRKNLNLMLECELTPGQISLPIARVQRTGSGSFAFDPQYIPTSLECGASYALMDCAGRIRDLLEEQSRALTATHAKGTLSLADAYRATPERFWLLHAIHSALAPLRHLLAGPQAHPEELYRELARLAGALRTFALDAAVAQAPLYDHDDPSPCFLELEHQIRTAVSTIRPQNFVRVPLEHTGQGMFAANVDDARCYQRSRWLLGLRCAAGEAKTIREIPIQAKVCSEPFVMRLVQSAQQAMQLVHLPAVPPGFPPQFDYEYFSIAQLGPCWQHLVQSRRIGMWIPQEFGETQAEIVVLLES